MALSFVHVRRSFRSNLVTRTGRRNGGRVLAIVFNETMAGVAKLPPEGRAHH
jgi:hypothetical protein